MKSIDCSTVTNAVLLFRHSLQDFSITLLILEKVVSTELSNINRYRYYYILVYYSLTFRPNNCLHGNCLKRSENSEVLSSFLTIVGPNFLKTDKDLSKCTNFTVIAKRMNERGFQNVQNLNSEFLVV